VRIAALLIAVVSLAACNRGSASNEAIRQAVLDHLAKAGMNTKAMDVSISSVQVNGNQAEATAAISLKGNSAVPAMSRKYHLEQQGSQWVVTTSQDAGANPHGGSAMPGGENPHGGGAMPGAGSGNMPSPEDLPPSSKKQ
jgi:hypothetical protein